MWLLDGEPVLSHGPPERQQPAPLALAEFFARCGTDFDLSLDLKGPGTAQRTVELARSAGFDLARLWLCAPGGASGPWRGLDRRVGLVTDLRWWDALLRPHRTLPALGAQGFDAVNLRHGRWSRSLVRQAHEAGLLAFAWDVQHAWTLRWAVSRGVDAVYSDHVRLLLDGR